MDRLWNTYYQAILLGAEKAIYEDNDPQALTATKKSVKKNNLDETQFYYFTQRNFRYTSKR